jgi:hypothetical protein
MPSQVHSMTLQPFSSGGIAALLVLEMCTPMYPSRHHRLDPGARPRLACPRLHRGARRGSLLAA